MPTLKEIRDQLVSRVTAIQYSGSAAFENVIGYPTANFEGYPTAVIVQSGGEANHETTADNQRYDTYDVHIFLMLDDAGKSRSAVTDQCYELMELVRNDFDDAEDLGLAGVLYASAAPVGLSIVNANNGLAIMGTVSVTVRHLYSIT